MPEFQRDDVTIHYDVDGTGPPLVFLHGGSLTGESWRLDGYVDALSDRHQCITVDLRGAGRSVAPPAPALRSLAANVGDVLAVMDREGIEAADLWGFSLGAYVAFELGARHLHRVRKIVSNGGYDPHLEVTVDDIERTIPMLEAPSRGMAAWLGAWEGRELQPLPQWFREMEFAYDRDSWLAPCTRSTRGRRRPPTSSLRPCSSSSARGRTPRGRLRQQWHGFRTARA